MPAHPLSDFGRAAPTDASASGNGRGRIIIIGAGFAGLCMAIRLRRAGRSNFLILEKGHDVGGTWRENTYPGAACDVESHLYSFSFRPNPNWSRTFSQQREILDYLRACTHDFGLEPHLRLHSAVTAARFDATRQLWQVTVNGTEILDCAILIAGSGPLSRPSLPDIPGRDSFAGRAFHSAQWDHDHDLAGRRIAVIGTGASAIQLVPAIAPLAAQLTVFQRTAPWVVPKADQAISIRRQRLFARLPWLQSALRSLIYLRREALVVPMVLNPRLMPRIERQVLRYMHHIVRDPALRAKITPNYRIGCKRILLSSDYLRSLTRPNVELVTEPIETILPEGLRTREGQVHRFDTLIHATGFITGNGPPPLDAVGLDGVSLAERWAVFPEAYLGTAMRDFPNFFMLVGPNTGLGHNSMVYMIEAQADYVMRCIAALERSGQRAMQIRPEAERAFNERLQARMRNTVWATGCRSWYMSDDGRNPSLWPGFTFAFRHLTRHFRAEHWEFSG